MARRNASRRTARRSTRTHSRPSKSLVGRSLYHRQLRLEPLEDRRLLAVVTVTTLTDTVDFTDGLTSLREAIFATNLVPGADTINFAPALTAGGPAKILLTGGELAITDSLTIDGPGANLLTIDASGNDPTPESHWGDSIVGDDGDGSRVISVDNGDANSLIDVSIHGATLTGSDTSGSGGAISSYENLTLDAVTISGNVTLGTAGVFSQSGDLVILSSTIAENLSSSGNAAAVDVLQGNLTMTDVVVTGNTLTSPINRAAIVSIQSGNAWLDRTTIMDNTIATNTLSFRAAVMSTSTHLSVDDCVISGNLNSSGIVAVQGNDTRIRNSTVADNRAFGIVISSLGGVIEITDCDVSHNGDTGIYMTTFGGTATIARCTVSNNSGINVGGIGADSAFPEGNAVGSAISIIDSVISGNTAVVTRGYGYNCAGGVRINLDLYSTALVSGSTIFNNAVVNAAGATAGSGGGVTLRSSFGTPAMATISDSSIYDNSAGSGGGVLLSNFRSTTILRTSVTGNRATVIGGGVLSRADERFFETLDVVESSVANNTAGLAGGGIDSFRTSLEVNRSTISGNTASGAGAFQGSGGGIFAADATIVESTIVGNTATGRGGGIIAFGPATIVDCTISHNSAETGGGAWLTNGTINQSAISTNTAVVAGGLYLSSGSVTHSTVTGNKASSNIGGGVFVSSGELALDHSIVAKNFFFVGQDVTGLVGATITAHDSPIGGSEGSGLAPAPIGSPDANGNLIGGPMFGQEIDPTLGPLVYNGGPVFLDGSRLLTHALLPGSPAINAGDPSAVAGVGGVPVNDERGAPFTRVYGGRIDIGAVEYQPNPLAGDYNFNGIVDGADYTVWRDTLGATTDLRADGNGDGVVTQLDYDVWTNHFGQTGAGADVGARSEERVWIWFKRRS